jgi:hypothetical protein
MLTIEKVRSGFLTAVYSTVLFPTLTAENRRVGQKVEPTQFRISASLCQEQKEMNINKEWMIKNESTKARTRLRLRLTRDPRPEMRSSMRPVEQLSTNS